MGLDLSWRAGGVGHVVGADHQGHVALRELGVDVVHLDQLVIGDVGLGQQHVHVARHAAGHRVDGELHVDAAARQHVVQLADLVLRLRHRHAVARHDDDAGRRPPGWRRPLPGWRCARGAAPRGRPWSGSCPNAPNSTLVNERFMALHMMIERIRPLEPSSAPATISSLLSSTKPMAHADRPA